MKHRNPEAMDRIIPFVNDFYRDNHRSPSLRQISAGTGIPHMTVKRMLNTLADSGIIDYDGETIVTEETNKQNDETVPVGIIGNIPCGNLSLEEEAIEEIVNLPVSIFGKGELFLLHARGDSMTGAGIDDGDLVLIRKQPDCEVGDIVVALDENSENTLKVYGGIDKRTKKVILKYANEAVYPGKRILVNELMVQGVARHVIKAL